MTTANALIGTAPSEVDDDEDELDSPRGLTRIAELPVYGATPPDRKWAIDSLVRELVGGQFGSAARLADAMLRDARIVGVLEQRNAGLFGASLELEPANDTALALRIRDEIADGWEAMFPRSELENMNQSAFLLGIGIAQKIWTMSERQWTFRIKGFHTQWCTWRWDLGAYTVVTLRDGLQTVRERSTQWLALTPYGYETAFLKGRLLAMLDHWLSRGWTRNDWSHYNEILGKPIRKAIVPQTASPKEEREYVDGISRMGNNTVIKCRQDADGNKYDIELVEAKANNWQTYEARLNYDAKEISNLALGQSMSTDGQGGLGSQEKPGEAIRGDVNASQNAKLSETLYAALKEYCAFNYGRPDLAPTWAKEKRSGYWRVEPPEDAAMIATMHYQQSQADASDIAAGILRPEEVALARYGGGEYSLSTALTAEGMSARERTLTASLERMEQEEQNAMEAAKDPPPTPGTQFAAGPPDGNDENPKKKADQE